jgi:hypothetical protein
MMADFLTDDDDLAQAVCVGETGGKPAQPFLPAHLRDASSVVSALLACSSSARKQADPALLA